MKWLICHRHQDAGPDSVWTILRSRYHWPANLSLDKDKDKGKGRGRQGATAGAGGGDTKPEDDDDNVVSDGCSFMMPSWDDDTLWSLIDFVGPASNLNIRKTLVEQHTPEIVLHGLVSNADVEKLFDM